jgi:ATP/maltotriose-dependent transcriptional regulator MalT
MSLSDASGGAKLSPPRLRPTDLEREALIDVLRPHRGLCLVVAPPGFGKTTLLAQWQQADERSFGWLTLDPRDNDPVVLWTYLISAVESLGNGDGTGNGSRRVTTTWLGRRPRLDVRKAIQRVSTELASFESDVVLVLDDCHTITEPECLSTLQAFLDLQPLNATISLSARSDPAVLIGARRVRTDLMELRAADLSFTIDECERLLNGALGLGLSSSAIRALWERTEGWPAGLHLAYLSLRDSFDREALVAQFRGVSRHVADYLTEVVIESQGERVREFLLRSSILDRMSGPLCDFVLETEGSAELLEELERGSLFIVALDDHREWYRYHRMFVELLREELQRARSRVASSGLDVARRAWRNHGCDTACDRGGGRRDRDRPRQRELPPNARVGRILNDRAVAEDVPEERHRRRRPAFRGRGVGEELPRAIRRGRRRDGERVACRLPRAAAGRRELRRGERSARARERPTRQRH